MAGIRDLQVVYFADRQGGHPCLEPACLHGERLKVSLASAIIQHMQSFEVAYNSVPASQKRRAWGGGGEGRQQKRKDSGGGEEAGVRGEEGGEAANEKRARGWGGGVNGSIEDNT